MLSFSSIDLLFAPYINCSICCSVKSSSRSSTTFVKLFFVMTFGSRPQSINSLQAFWMSSLLSFWLIFTIMISKNYWKSILVSSNFAFSFPLPRSRMRLLIYSLLGSNPSARRTTFKFLASMVPDPEMSKKSKAFLIQFFCEEVRTCWLFKIFLRLFWVCDTGACTAFGLDFIILQLRQFKINCRKQKDANLNCR